MLRTASENSVDVEADALRAYEHSLRLRLVLIIVGAAVAFPGPWAMYWGGSVVGSPLATLCVIGVWAAVGLTVYQLGARTSVRTDQAHTSELIQGSLLLVDVAALTALLSQSGAAQNPFTMLYFVPMTWATAVAPRWTWRVALAAVGGFSLLLWQTTQATAGRTVGGHHAHFYHHVVGMTIALAVAGAFIAYLVHRIGLSLFRQQRAISRFLEQRQRDRLTVAMGALAAGAAHELGTPLATIQVLAEELEFLEPKERTLALSTLVSEVQRSKNIVHRLMSSELSADLLRGKVSWTMSDLLEEVPSQIKSVCSGDGPVVQPQSVVAQLLREFIKNARAVASDSEISVALTYRAPEFTVSVVDLGCGMTDSEIERAIEPFVSFQGGTGMGLFLAHIHAQQLGGKMILKRGIERGLVVSLVLPTGGVLSEEFRATEQKVLA